ncbi:DEAD H (Asp-Glu-Ala-Asp His) box helicase 11 [Chamberlinius hualienensis]
MASSVSSTQMSITKFLNKSDKKSIEVSPTQFRYSGNVPKATVEAATVIPTDFSFPYQPYSIQQNLMKEVYKCIDQGKLGIFESPTGTGKSLSLLCASLTWLVEHEANRRKRLEDEIKQAELDAQFIAELFKNKLHLKPCLNQQVTTGLPSYGKKRNETAKITSLKEDFSKFVRVDEKIKSLKTKKFKKVEELKPKNESEIDEFLKEIQNVRSELAAIENEIEVKLDEELMLKDYESDDDETSDDKEVDENDEFNSNVTKIFFCSRTHSQLSQFVGEVKKTTFKDQIRLVALSSRQNSCLNESVTKLKSVNAMNDRCLELQNQKRGKETKCSDDGCQTTKKKKVSDGCLYFKQNAIRDLQENILTQIGDIEDCVSSGHKLKACPYYSSRFALPLAQLVVLPYNTLLNKQTREACGIKLKNNIVIIDEAHNLLSAICNMHSCEINGNKLMLALSQLSAYKQRFNSRLKAKNLYYVQQIIFILQNILKYLKEKSSEVTEKKSEDFVLTLNEFVVATDIDNLNLFKILRYCKKSEISRKLMGFTEKYIATLNNKQKKKSSIGVFLENLTNGKKVQTEDENGKVEEKAVSSPFMQIEELFRCLTNSNVNGRIVITKCSSVDDCVLKYYLLNPAAHFQEVVSQARSVILAGGTLQPVDEFTEQLFRLAKADMTRIMHFSCGHVISASHLLSIGLSQGPGGQTFDFSYQNRTSPSLLDELGRAIQSICNIVPGGIVCFFSSYSYAELVISHWENSKTLPKIDAKKKVFVEPKKVSESSEMFDEYSKCIMESKANISSNSSAAFVRTGAILFCVVGGKMSEGINFSDDLGRCVIMIGMPYPNKTSAELQEKMKYLDTTLPSSPNGKMPGQQYYENICMKAVNQSIGRAIRHRNDYATIILLDTRFSRLSVQQALPQWIQSQIKTCQKFGQAFGAIRKFFQGFKTTNE